jgi:hypothetical protein
VGWVVMAQVQVLKNKWEFLLCQQRNAQRNTNAKLAVF